MINRWWAAREYLQVYRNMRACDEMDYRMYFKLILIVLVRGDSLIELNGKFLR